MLTTPCQIAQLSNLSEAFHAIYTDSEMMLAWLAAPVTLRDKLARAINCSHTAAAPGYRFKLEAVPSNVKAAIKAFIATCLEAAAPIKAAIIEFRAAGHAWDTTWYCLDDSQGFGPGDAQLLGVASAGRSKELQEELARG